MAHDNKPAVVALDMGYGHLRAARSLADAFDVALLHADRAPLADDRDQAFWRRLRALYEVISRSSQLGMAGAPLKRLLDDITDIAPLYPPRDQSAPHTGIRLLEALVNRGAGEELVAWLRGQNRPLLTTFYAPAIMADRLGYDDVHCLITDSDLNRIWVAKDPVRSRVRYLAPSPRVVDRLRAYGVPDERIQMTGFPLPCSLVGVDDEHAKQNLKERLVRLDPTGCFRKSHRAQLESELGAIPEGTAASPPHIAFAIGGAGAQTELARQIAVALGPALRDRQFRLTLVAGTRPEVAEKFNKWLKEDRLADVGIEILFEPTFDGYYEAFNRMLAGCDVLWTKPSEITFYTALGIPLVFSPSVGVHERYNRRWAVERGGGLEQRDTAHAALWLREWLAEGTLAAAAWSGYMRFPRRGTYEIQKLFSDR